MERGNAIPSKILLSAMMGLFVGALAAFVQGFIVKAHCSMRPTE